MSQRLMKEFREASQSKDKDIKLTVQDNLYKWTAYLQGPEGTPFEGGCFEVGISALSAPPPRFLLHRACVSARHAWCVRDAHGFLVVMVWIGRAQVQLDVHETYPLQAPKARFITRVFHPNIHFKTGEVRLHPRTAICRHLRSHPTPGF